MFIFQCSQPGYKAHHPNGRWEHNYNITDVGNIGLKHSCYFQDRNWIMRRRRNTTDILSSLNQNPGMRMRACITNLYSITGYTYVRRSRTRWYVVCHVHVPKTGRQSWSIQSNLKIIGRQRCAIYTRNISAWSVVVHLSKNSKN